VKFRRDNGYKQQKRLKHERAINKYTGKLKEKKTTKVIYYLTKKLEINLILKVSSPQRDLLTEDNQIFAKVSKLDVSMVSASFFTLCPRNSCYVQRFCFVIFSASLFYAQNMI